MTDGRHFKRNARQHAPRRSVGARRSFRVKAARLLGVVLLLVGCGVFFYPPVSEWVAARDARQEIAHAMLESASGNPSGTTSGKRSKDDAAYEYLRTYNERVRTGEAGSINDPWGIGSDKDELAQVGLPDGILGSLSIPAMGITLPLYLGSSQENMAHGATVTSGTSAPLGEVDSNVLIAAHRGAIGGLPMFRDIENLQQGDKLVIDTLWDTLTYRVVKTRVISPQDTDAVKIQAGRDMVTLLTCHPYGSNARRYVVYCERIAGQDEGTAENNMDGCQLNPLEQALEPSSSILQVTERWIRLAGMGVIALVAAVLLIRGIKAVVEGLLRR